MNEFGKVCVMFLSIKSSTMYTCKGKMANVNIFINIININWVTKWNICTIFEHQQKHVN